MLADGLVEEGTVFFTMEPELAALSKLGNRSRSDC
jgi:hypothetical protein